MRLLLFLLFGSFGLSAQSALTAERLVENGTLTAFAEPKLELRLDDAVLPAPTSQTPTDLPASPAAWRYQDLAFFCRVEVQLERKTRLPVRFRLGSAEYVDLLEGK